MEQPRLVTSDVLARQLGVSRRSISRYVQRGWLVPAFTTPGGVYKFDVDEARKQLEAIAKSRRESD